uniref:Uncharacterized protein n=1 Tax=Zea mays TaxID=4577 RepID=A0A804PMX9_MAIZE
MNNKDILTHKFDEQSTKFLSQFTPTQWDKDQWHPFMGPLRLCPVAEFLKRTKSLLWFSLYLNDISDKVIIPFTKYSLVIKPLA